MGGGGLITLLNKESYHYALSRDMTQAAWVKQSTGDIGLWPIDGHNKIIMYTDIDLEYHSHLSTSFSPTIDKPLIHTDARRSD